MSAGTRATGALSLAELTGVTTWVRRCTGQCVGCWAEQRIAARAGASVPRRRPVRWGAQLHGRPVGLCERHRAELDELPRQAAGGGRR